MSLFKPMLAGKVDFSCLRYPVLGSPKLDGIRATVVNGRLLSRTLKPIPNLFTQSLFARPELEWLDGELIVGDPVDKACYRNTVSGVMSQDGEPDVRFFVFDWAHPDYRHVPWVQRSGLARDHCRSPANRVEGVRHEQLFEYEAVCDYEQEMLARGHEGIMLRDPHGPYKLGRSTVNEGYLLKVKRYEDSEAVIIGMEEEMENQNELTTDERGYAKRTSHQANKVGKGTMGALLVRDVKTGIESRIGTGFDYRTRLDFWRNKDDYLGHVVKYKYFPVGVKDKPRHPVFIGMRPEGA